MLTRRAKAHSSSGSVV